MMQCFFPPNIIKDMKTPLFILNAAYDVIQVNNNLYGANTLPSSFVVSHVANAIDRSDFAEPGSGQS
jgi:hypothetical protein